MYLFSEELVAYETPKVTNIGMCMYTTTCLWYFEFIDFNILLTVFQSIAIIILFIA